jgi:UDP-N-acetylmuramate dehydrogenase
MNLQEHAPLAPRTTLGLGGPARWLCVCPSLEDLREALRLARSRGVRAAVIGGGSNLIVPDEGFEGLVIAMQLRGITATPEGDTLRVTAAAGEPWDAFVAHTVERGWAGLECLSGIPGLVGATPIQNVGAYGQEVSETISSVEVLNRETLERSLLPPEACGFGYRTSAFKTGGLRDAVVIGVTFRLRTNGTPTVRYPELQRHVESAGGTRTLPGGAEGLHAVRQAVLQLRRRKSMVVDPSDPHSRSVGSFFTNPVLTSKAFEAATLRWKKSGSGEAIPSFPVSGQAGTPAVAEGASPSPLKPVPSDAGPVKVPAAWLVEHAGFAKGYRDGNVGISVNHALALVNYGGTTSALLALAGRIQAAVQERFGIVLEREPVVLQ